MPFLLRLWLLWCAGLLPLAAEFVVPAEGPVPFRRDRLPLDVDTMTALSRQVTRLAGAVGTERPDERRRVAQALALALALDPENREARDGLRRMKSAGKLEPVGEQELERARSRAWQVMGWLEMPEAGDDGHALATCLGDVLAAADPQNPKAEQRRESGEQGAWQGWVAAIADFRPKPPPETAPIPEDPPPVPENPLGKLALKAVKGKMPLWSTAPEAKEPALNWVPVSLVATSGEGAGALFALPQVKNPAPFLASLKEVETAMRRRHGALPEGLRANLSWGGRDYPLDRNGLAVSGTAALLMEGAMTGAVPAASALAVVGKDGKLELPPRFWQTLRAMSELPEGSRLVVPAAAADFLTALVTLDDAVFFMKNEVLLADTVEEMCDLAAADPDASVADGFERFQAIRSVGEGKALGSFVAHPSTQQRLRELVGAMPNHASARMLALQGSGNRPRFLERSILAREIRSALEPAACLIRQQVRQAEPEVLEQAHADSRAGLDRLAGYLAIGDRDLHKQAVAVADSLRTLARLLPKTDPYQTLALMEKQAAAYRSARNEYILLLRSLNVIAGDAESFPLPSVDDEE